MVMLVNIPFLDHVPCLPMLVVDEKLDMERNVTIVEDLEICVAGLVVPTEVRMLLVEFAVLPCLTTLVFETAVVDTSPPTLEV